MESTKETQYHQSYGEFFMILYSAEYKKSTPAIQLLQKNAQILEMVGKFNTIISPLAHTWTTQPG